MRRDVDRAMAEDKEEKNKKDKELEETEANKREESKRKESSEKENERGNEKVAVTKVAINGTICILVGDCHPKYILLQPTDKEGLDELVAEADFIKKQVSVPFCLIGVSVESWNRDLSPWEAEPVFGKEAFGGQAAAFLEKIETSLLPRMFLKYRQYGIRADLPILLGGYSLAGLFALWAAYQSEHFCGIAAVSPSVWFPGWMEYAKTHVPHVQKVYFSLGDREEKTRNRTMAVVGDHIRAMQEVLDPFVSQENRVLKWNKGNHFQNTTERTARGFVWLLSEFEKQENRILR